MYLFVQVVTLEPFCLVRLSGVGQAALQPLVDIT